MEFKTNDYEFECHHGPKECEGNKIQACALKLIDQGRNTEDLGFNKWVFCQINYSGNILIPKGGLVCLYRNSTER